MKKLLNTLFVTTQGAFVGCEGETVKIRIEEETRLRVPIHLLDGIVCFGQVLVSQHLMALCSERGVAISYLSENGRFMARVLGRTHGNVLLRREQFRRADDATASRGIARILVAGKIHNCRIALQRALRDRVSTTGEQELRAAVVHLASIQKQLALPGLEVAQLRGYEGEAAREYFSVFDHLIVAQKDTFTFTGRSRRPPLDRTNCLLSFLYTLLVHDVTSALEGVGLDPAVGYLHEDRPGRPCLALDLMEEFRPVLADRIALTLINRQQLKQGDFRILESGAVELTDEGRKVLLVCYQERKKDSIRHPFLDEEMPMGMLPHIQARLFSRFLRGDLEAYPPFLWR